jgi:hypothetical protein
MYLPKDKALKEKVLREAYESKFMAHLGSTKMKKEITKFVAKCRVFQQAKMELRYQLDLFLLGTSSTRIAHGLMLSLKYLLTRIFLTCL